MSLRFAAAGSGECSAIERVLTMPRMRPAANDSDDEPSRDMVLREALRHFAAHGLGAAESARQNAEAAFFAGDRTAYRHWLAICRMLDRRLADAAGAIRPADRF